MESLGSLFQHKFGNSGLMPEFSILCKLYKSAMSTMLRKFQKKMRIAAGFFDRKAFSIQHRIVLSADHERGDANTRQQGFGTGLLPIILGIFKAVQGGGVPIIVVLEGSDFMKAFVINFARHDFLLRPDFASEGADKPIHIDEVLRTG